MAYAQTLTPRPGLGLPGAGALVVLALGTIALALTQGAAQGALFLVGALIMAFNLWMTVNAGQASETEGAGALQPAE